MADDRLRSLARRAAESGCVEDQARYLRERVRTGGLTYGHLEIAAILEHEPSRLAIPDDYFHTEEHRADTLHTSGWPMHYVVRRLAKRCDLKTVIRIAIALSRCIYRVWHNGQVDSWASDVVGAPRLAIEAATLWCVRPTSSNVEACRAALTELQRINAVRHADTWKFGPPMLVSWVSSANKSHWETLADVLSAIVSAAEALPFNHYEARMRRMVDPRIPILDGYHTYIPRETLLAALQADLFPILLELRDPLETRVERGIY